MAEYEGALEEVRRHGREKGQHNQHYYQQQQNYTGTTIAIITSSHV